MPSAISKTSALVASLLGLAHSNDDDGGDGATSVMIDAHDTNAASAMLSGAGPGVDSSSPISSSHSSKGASVIGSLPLWQLLLACGLLLLLIACCCALVSLPWLLHAATGVDFVGMLRGRQRVRTTEEEAEGDEDCEDAEDLEEKDGGGDRNARDADGEEEEQDEEEREEEEPSRERGDVQFIHHPPSSDSGRAGRQRGGNRARARYAAGPITIDY